MKWRPTILIAVWFVAGGCTINTSLIDYHRLDLPAHSDAPILDELRLAELLNDVRSGDIILGVKEDPITTFIRLGTIEPAYFTHSGVIEVIQDHRGDRDVRVWHAIGDFSLLHLSPHILGKVRGGVRQIALTDFVRMYDSLAIVRPPDLNGDVMVAECRRLQAAGVEFDPFADCIDHASICCTELTALAINAAGASPPLQPIPRTRNIAISSLLYGWNVMSPAFFTAGQLEFVPRAQTVAVLSKYGRQETYLAMRDANALLHERLVGGVLQVTDLVAFSASRLTHYQPRMELFLRAVEGLARAEPSIDSEEIRRRNDTVFGVVFDRKHSGRAASEADAHPDESVTHTP